MDDPYGFLRYPRQEALKEPALTRIKHWREYVPVMPDRQAACQANRCMECGTPFCHSACPLNNLVPEWNHLVFNADWKHAWEQLESTNNFPEFTGRVCPAPCEDACTLSLSDHPVTIKCIEMVIAEHAWQQGWVQAKPARHRRRERVTIVGSGPAGLACAQMLARVGYPVSVIEKSDRIGGLLRYGIPDFRLQKTVLDRRLSQLVAEGVQFHAGCQAGDDIPVAELRETADAVVLACGSEQPRQLRVPGRELDGIHYALPYLSRQNRCLAGDVVAPDLSMLASGKDVVIIGGGDTGSDCAGTALRQSARHVTRVQYHDEPPGHADVLRYWPDHVPQFQPDDHDAEGCVRLWGWDTVGFEGRQGRVEGVLLQRLHWTRGKDGGWEKLRVQQQPRRLPAQLVLLAMGYAHPVHEGLVEAMGLQLDDRGNVSADDTSYRTSEPGVFSCGDMRRGQSLVVWAIREGRRCARAVDEWLSGESELPWC